MNDNIDISQRQKLKIPYEAIIEAASPGDILFFISDTGKLKNNSWFYRQYRKWLGFYPLDTTEWHTTVYVGPKKESKGARFRPYFVHSVPKGTFETYVPPEYFSNTETIEGIQQNRIEIIHCPSIENGDREKIVDYCRQQLGKPFDDDERWYRNMVTLLLGLKSVPKDPEKVSCHGLAFDAYGLIGMTFQHHLENAPNLLGRIIGHPVGHPPEYVDLRSNYLRDHFLYRDHRFHCTINLCCSRRYECDVEIRTNQAKYSWNPALQNAYGLGGN